MHLHCVILFSVWAGHRSNGRTRNNDFKDVYHLTVTIEVLPAEAPVTKRRERPRRFVDSIRSGLEIS